MEAWTAARTEYGHWLFSWSGAPTDIFTVWLEGEQIDTVTGTEYDFAMDGYYDAPPPLEIVDDEDDAESDLYPPYAILQWRTVDGADSYLVEEYVDSAWEYRRSVRESGAGWYMYKTDMLDDLTSVQYRVSALNLRGSAGTAVSYTFTIARNPDTPEVAYTIDESNDLSVAAAS